MGEAPIKNNNHLWAIYFFLFFFLTNFLVINLFIGVFVEKYFYLSLKASLYLLFISRFFDNFTNRKLPYLNRSAKGMGSYPKVNTQDEAFEKGSFDS